MKVIILAGGSGERLWPLSRSKMPKQFIKFPNRSTSLFQDAFLRASKLTSYKDIYIVTNILYKDLVFSSIKELKLDIKKSNVLVEPAGKNTLPAIYAGVYEILKNQNDIVCVFSSDHLILDSEKFVEILIESQELAKNNLITFGIHADSPNTGYGYISPGQRILNGFVVSEFKEKPLLNEAINYIDKGYYWNAGIFMFDAELFQKEVRKHSFLIYKAFKKTENLYDAFNEIEEKISIDKGIMEKSDKVVMVPADIGWDDIGSFNALYKFLEKDEMNNVSNSEIILIDSKSNFVNTTNNKLVALIGVNDLIIIDCGDVLLISDNHDTQKIKNVVNLLKKNEDKRIVNAQYQNYFWGIKEELKKQFDYSIYSISVNTSKKYHIETGNNVEISIDFIVGTAIITIDGNSYNSDEYAHIVIRKNQKCSIENIGDSKLNFVEIHVKM